MSRREPYEMKTPAHDGAQVFWKSLEDKANPAAAQKRAEMEFPLGLEEAKSAKLVKLRKGKSGEAALEAPVGRRGFMFFAGASAALFYPRPPPTAAPKIAPDAVPRPATWGGYRVRPETVEFWQGRRDRRHDRLVYRHDGDDGWVIERLAP